MEKFYRSWNRICCCNYLSQWWDEFELTWCDFTNFSKQISTNVLQFCFRFRWMHALYIGTISNFSRYSYDQSDQFDEFFTVIYGGFLPLDLTVRGRRRQPAHPPKSAKKFPFMQGVVHKWRHHPLRGQGRVKLIKKLTKHVDERNDAMQGY